jgi:formylglycine-generating enzyme required for sulfatase activity
MFEIAERAGANTTYYWGDAMDLNYVVSSDNSASSTMAVGSKLPNAWGLYDTAGNVREWCLDNWSDGNLTLRADALTPPSQGSPARRTRGGGNWAYPASDALFHASCRDYEGSDARSEGIGFRVSWIVE